MKISFKNSLISITGKPLIQHPGLVYPKSILQAPKGYRPETGKAYPHVPAGMISTKQVSEMLSASPSGTRQYLERKKIKFAVAQTNGKTGKYWDREQVELLIKSRCPLVECPPNKYYSTSETREILGVARSALYRMARKGLLVEKKVRLRTKRGVRVKSFYLKSSVHRVAKRTGKSGTT